MLNTSVAQGGAVCMCALNAPAPTEICRIFSFLQIGGEGSTPAIDEGLASWVGQLQSFSKEAHH
jgi:hypothetical protein